MGADVIVEEEQLPQDVGAFGDQGEDLVGLLLNERPCIVQFLPLTEQIGEGEPILIDGIGSVRQGNDRSLNGDLVQVEEFGIIGQNRGADPFHYPCFQLYERFIDPFTVGKLNGVVEQREQGFFRGKLLGDGRLLGDRRFLGKGRFFSNGRLLGQGQIRGGRRGGCCGRLGFRINRIGDCNPKQGADRKKKCEGLFHLGLFLKKQWGRTSSEQSEKCF